MNQLINLFIYGLFNDSVSKPGYIASVAKFRLFEEGISTYF